MLVTPNESTEHSVTPHITVIRRLTVRQVVLLCELWLVPRILTSLFTYRGRCLGGVVVSVLVTGPKVCGFEPGQGDGFLRAIKFRSTPSSRMGSKAGRSHVVRLYGM
jgi:hypothetical protein